MHPGLIALLAFAGTAGAVAVGAVVVDRINTPDPVEQAQEQEAPAEQPAQALGLIAPQPEVMPETTADATPEPEVTAQEPVPETPAAPVLDIVRIEPTGEVLIAGSAEPGTQIALLYNEEPFADTLSEPSGDFVLIPDQPLPPGEATLQIVIVDEDGNTLVLSEEQVAVVVPEAGSDDGFLVGILRPNEPIDIIERQAPNQDDASTSQEPATADAEVEVAALDEEASQDPVEPVIQESVEGASQANGAQADVETASQPVEVPTIEIVSRIEPAFEAAPAPEDTAVAVEPEPAVETAAAPQPESPTIEEPVAPEPFVLVDAIELEGLQAWIAGGALPGTIVRLYQDNELLGEVLVAEQGRFLYEGTLMPDSGEVVIRADALRPGSADVIARAEVPFDMPAPVVEVATTLTPQQTPAPTATTEVAATAPAAPATPQPAPATSERVSVLDTGQVIIRRGDNLWRLSRRVYGLGIRYTSIYDANRAQIRDPELIFPGQVFELPTPEAEWGDVPGLDALEPDQIPGALEQDASSN